VRMHDCRDAGGTSPWMGKGRTIQEQLSRAMPGAIAEGCTDSGLHCAKKRSS